MLPSRTGASHRRRKEESLLSAGFLPELVQWLRHNEKWWLAPLLVVLLLVSALVLMSGTAAFPFIYTLF